MTNVSIYGRLTKDPDIRVTKDDENFYVLFTIASKQGVDKTSFIPCTAFGKTAEVIGNYFKKGSRIYAEGNLQSYEKDGKEKLGVNVLRVDFVDSKSEKEEKAELNNEIIFYEAEADPDRLPF